MMKNTLLMLAGCIFLLQSINAQEGEASQFNDQIGLEFGIVNVQLNDVNFSPLNYSTTDQILGLNYTHAFPRSEWSIRAHYLGGTMKTSVNDFESEYYAGAFRLKWLRDISSVERLMMGVQYQTQILYLDWENQEAFTFLANHGLDLSARYAVLKQERWSLDLTLDIPVLSLLVRPPYNGSNEELVSNNDEGRFFRIITNGELVTIPKLFSFNSSLVLGVPLTERLQLQVLSQLNYIRTKETNTYKSLQTQATLGLAFQF